MNLCCSFIVEVQLPFVAFLLLLLRQNFNLLRRPLARFVLFFRLLIVRKIKKKNETMMKNQ